MPDACATCWYLDLPELNKELPRPEPERPPAVLANQGHMPHELQQLIDQDTRCYKFIAVPAHLPFSSCVPSSISLGHIVFCPVRPDRVASYNARMSSSDEQAITKTLLAYGEGLNTASVSQCVKQYDADGICMPQHQPASQGTDALNKTYEGFFKMIKFDVKFDIKEVNVVTSEWAFARTTSAGTTVIGGHEQHEANQELFVMKNVGGEWKIARYCFCTTNPPK